MFCLWLLSICSKDIGLSIVLDLFAQHSFWGVGSMHVICTVHKDVDVVLLSVLLCMHHWL
jgi:hypothetical protein